MNIFNWTTVLYSTLSAGLGFREKTGYKRRIQSQEGDTDTREGYKDRRGIQDTGKVYRVRKGIKGTGEKYKVRKDTELGKGNRTQS